jgi:hypothetical protein
MDRSGDLVKAVALCFLRRLIVGNGGVMAIEPPTGSTRDYLLAFGIAAVYVAVPPMRRELR